MNPIFTIRRMTILSSLVKISFAPAEARHHQLFREFLPGCVHILFLLGYYGSTAIEVPTKGLLTVPGLPDNLIRRTTGRKSC
jgi:hypothetical protein